jgi:protein gp37
VSTGTGIEWTDATWQVTSGCTMVSPGCAHCYAETMANRIAGMAKKDIKEGIDAKRKGPYLKVIGPTGKWNSHIELLEGNLSIPLKRKKATMYFVNSMSDLFHKDVPMEFIDRVFAVMASCPQHTFQVLTKRPERMAQYLCNKDRWVSVCNVVYAMELATEDRKFADHANRVQCDFENHELWPLPNVWLGTSVEVQANADKRIPELLKCPAAVRFLSCEPLLGPIDLLRVRVGESLAPHNPEHRIDALRLGYWSKGWGYTSHSDLQTECDGHGIDWVIVGGESGARARPCYTHWIDGIVAQCKAAGVPVFVKQLGSKHRCLDEEFGDVPIDLRDGKGGEMAEFPENLRVREFPAR